MVQHFISKEVTKILEEKKKEMNDFSIIILINLNLIFNLDLVVINLILYLKRSYFISKVTRILIQFNTNQFFMMATHFE
jgi:hypothetical protein